MDTVQISRMPGARAQMRPSCGCQVRSASYAGGSTGIQQTSLKQVAGNSPRQMEIRQTQQMLAEFGYNLGPTGVDGIWGPYTQKAWDSFIADKFGGGFGSNSRANRGDGSGRQYASVGAPPTSAVAASACRPGQEVNLARQYVGMNSIDVKGQLPHFQAAGGQTNNCADFVSAVLKNSGKLQSGSANVTALEGRLAQEGWRPVPAGQAKPGDVWIAHSRGHVELVAAEGGTKTIGSTNDRPGHQVIMERANRPESGVYYSKSV